MGLNRFSRALEWLIEMLEGDEEEALPAGWWIVPAWIIGIGALAAGALIWGWLAPVLSIVVVLFGVCLMVSARRHG